MKMSAVVLWSGERILMLQSHVPFVVVSVCVCV
jgi:hypothetical protein